MQRRRFPVGASPTRQPLQPEAIGAVMEVTKWLKPSISVSRIGDSASVQAATRVNAEQSSKRTMRRSTRQPYRGRLIRLDEMSEAIRSDPETPRVFAAETLPLTALAAASCSNVPWNFSGSFAAQNAASSVRSTLLGEAGWHRADLAEARTRDDGLEL